MLHSVDTGMIYIFFAIMINMTNEIRIVPCELLVLDDLLQVTHLIARCYNKQIRIYKFVHLVAQSCK